MENNMDKGLTVAKWVLIKVSYIQNEFMRSSFLPKCKPKITRISALANKQGSEPKKMHTLTKKKSPKKSVTILFYMVGQKSL